MFAEINSFAKGNNLAILCNLFREATTCPDRTVPLVLHETDGIGQTHRIMLVGEVGFHRTVPLLLYVTGGIG